MGSGPPFTAVGIGAATDSSGRIFKLRSSVLQILLEIKHRWPKRRGTSPSSNHWSAELKSRCASYALNAVARWMLAGVPRLVLLEGGPQPRWTRAILQQLHLSEGGSARDSVAALAGHVLLHDHGSSGSGIRPLLRRMQRETDVSFNRMLLFVMGAKDQEAADHACVVSICCPSHAASPDLGLSRASWLRGKHLFAEGHGVG
jgi:hypothetical protein